LAAGVPDETDPPRKHYGFKERSFKRDNVAGEGPAPTTGDLAKLATARTTPRPGAATGAQAGANSTDPNDVHAVLRENRANERAHGINEVEIRKVSSRRKREYWFVLITAELGFGTLVYLGWNQNPFFFVYGICGMVIVGLGVTWIMWHIMEKY
jgi:hypothetical protein